MTRVVLVKKDKKFPQLWKFNGRGIHSTTNAYRCMWCDGFTRNHIPVIHNDDERSLSHYGVCMKCATSLYSYWKNDT
jgi:hypothetical protein